MDSTKTMTKELEEVTELKFTDWANEPTLDQLKRDYFKALPFHQEYTNKLNKWITARDGGKELPKVKGRSNYKSMTIRKAYEKVYAAIEEPLLNNTSMVAVIPKHSGAEDIAKVNAELLKYQWSVEIPSKRLLTAAIRNFTDEGTAVLKLGWEFDYKIEEVEKDIPIYVEDKTAIREFIVENSTTLSEEDIEALTNGTLKIETGKTEKRTIEQIKVITNKPSVTLKENGDLLVDPTSKGLVENINYVIDVTTTTFAELKKNEQRLIKSEYEDGTVSEKLVGFYRNLDSITEFADDTNITYQDNAEKAAPVYKNKSQKETGYTQDGAEDQARQLVTVYEYWGNWDITGTGKLEAITASWVGDVLIRLERNPYAHQRIPYYFAAFMPVKNEIMGEPNAEIVCEDQEAINAIRRGMADISSRGAIGQEFIHEDLFATPVHKIAYNEGKTVMYRGPRTAEQLIFRQKPENVPQGMFTMLSLHKRDIADLTGTPMEAGPLQGANASGGLGVEDISGSKTQRDTSILGRFVLMLRDLFKDIMLLNQDYIVESKIIRLTNKKFMKIEGGALKGAFDVQIDIETSTAKNDKANKIIKLLQTNAATMSTEMANLHYIKLAKLWGFDDLSNEIEEQMKRPPSEAETLQQKIQLESLQLQNNQVKLQVLKAAKEIEEIDSKIEERMSRATENIEADVAKKQAEANYRNAAANKMEAQTDLFREELDYVASGRKRDDAEIDAEFQHNANLEREGARTEREEKVTALRNKVKTDPIVKSSVEKAVDSTIDTNTNDGSEYLFDNILDKNHIPNIDKR